MLRIGLLGLLAGLTSTTPARADIVVIGTNSPGIDIGTVMTNDQTLELPEGASVRIMAPSGKTQSLSGPLTKSVQELSGTTPADSSLWESVKAQYTSRDVDLKLEGKTRGLAAKPAAPAAAPKPAAAPYKFSWVSVPVFADGDMCVDKGAKLSLVRANSAKGGADRGRRHARRRQTLGSNICCRKQVKFRGQPIWSREQERSCSRLPTSLSARSS